MNDLHAKNKKILFAGLGVVALMIALSFAAVPLYSMFCKATGFGGTTMLAKEAPKDISERTIKVLFDARVDAGLPWDFKPETRSLTVKIGQQGLIAFQATNVSARQTKGTAVYNVTPEKVGKYFNKTQCFCFAEQELPPGKSAHFPVVFFIDPAILKDPDLEDVTDITLSYTFFPADSKALDDALSRYGQ